MNLKNLIFGRKPEFNYFRTVREVLKLNSAAIAAQQKLTEAQVRARMVSHMEHFSGQYFTGQKPQIPYCDPTCRTAYLYSYVAANANLCEVAIRDSDDLVELIKTRSEEEGELRVCAFGGGPGTELLALTKYLIVRRKKGPQVALSFLLVDLVPQWVETWSQLEAQIRKFLKDNFGKVPSWPLNVNKSFMPFDMTDLSQFGNVKQLFGQDLYLFNYVISELYGPEEIESMQEVVQAMADSAEPGSKFLIVDRRENRFVNRAKELLENSGLSVGEATEHISNMDSDEQCSDLGDQLITERNPRVTWNAFWIIGTKE